MRFLWNLFVVLLLFIFMLIGAIVIIGNDQCEHEESRRRYVFVPEYNFETEYSSAANFCKECGERVTTYSQFKGELIDKSYLGAIVEHSDANEIVSGEYYTIRAVAPIGYSGYGNKRVYLVCEVENDEYIVRFTADFREEFRVQVASIEEGDEITFRGRFYDQGCGFTDCELISK